MNVAHWDDVEPFHAQLGPMDARWRDLGDATGSRTVGVQRIEVAPERRSTPVHLHGAEEEIFFVLAGSGLSWQDGATHEIGACDCLVHRASEVAHTLIAGPEGVDVLAFGMRVPVESTLLPRAGLFRLPGGWAPGHPDAEQHPWEREAEAGELDPVAPSPRPSTIVALSEVEGRETDRGPTCVVRRDLGRAAGSEFTGMVHVEVAPGRRSHPAHCHSAEEELFVVLGGEGTLFLGEEEHPVWRGSVVARPAGTGVAHAFAAGDQGLEYLAYGTRDPSDVCFYPRSGKISFRGVGVIGRLERLDYWEGEE